MDHYDEFTIDISWYTIAEIVPTIIGFVSLLILSRSFSSASYGQYTLVISVVTILATVCYGWLEQSALRYESNDDITDALIANMGVVTVGSILLAAALFVVKPIKLGGFDPLYIPATCLLVIRGGFRVVRAVIQARLDSRLVTVLDVGRSTIGLCAGVAFGVFLLRDISGWIWGLALGTGCALVIGWKRALSPFGGRTDLDLAIRMALFGFPMIGWLLGQTALEFADRFLLEALQGSEAVGAYSAHYLVASRSVLLVLTPVIQAAHPILMETWSQETESDFNQKMANMTRYIILLGLPTAVGVGFLGYPLSRLVFTEGYRVHPFVIPLVAFGLFFWNLAMIVHKPLEVREQSKKMLVGVAVAVGLNVAFNIPLINIFGPLGASISTLFSFSFYLIYVLLSNGDNRAWRLPHGTVRNVILGSIIMTVSLSIAMFSGLNRIYVILLTPVYAGIYFGVLYVLNEFTPSEKEMIRTTVRRN